MNISYGLPAAIYLPENPTEDLFLCFVPDFITPARLEFKFIKRNIYKFVSDFKLK